MGFTSPRSQPDISSAGFSTGIGHAQFRKRGRLLRRAATQWR